MSTTTTKAWLVLTFGDDRQHAGNAGYDDDPGKWYSYDSYVANHLQLAEGHLAIVCDRAKALGIARITKIDSEPSTRVLQRCPVCKSTGIKLRRNLEPAFRCKKGHEFEDPEKEDASCTKYTAHFGDTFTPFSEHFPRSFLRQGCPRYSDQLAMQAFDFLSMEEAFHGSYPLAAGLIGRMISDAYLSGDEAEESAGAARDVFQITEGDERQVILRQIRARRGQQLFRETLRSRYGERCMISGCDVLDVLEAAHIRPYRGDGDNHAENGLLLRADLHTLFDLDLIGIEPSALTIHLNPDVKRHEYMEMQGRTLLCAARCRPSEQALTLRWQAFLARAAPTT